MRIAVWLLTLALPATAFAQKSARDVLITAQHANWYVRVSTDRDTVDGAVRSVFRDSARIGNRRVYVPAITRIEQRVRAREPIEWLQVWPAQTREAARDTTSEPGFTSYVYAGTGMLVAPEVFFPLPPPVLAGIQIGSRNSQTEFTLNGRVLIYPAAFAIFGFDAGVNYFSRPASYTGIAAGFVTSSEGGFLITGAARGGIRRHGVRLEGRVDVVAGSGVGAVASVTLGFDKTQHKAK